MKNRIITPILLATLLFAVGCSKSGGEPSDGGQPIRFGVGVRTIEATRSGAVEGAFLPVGEKIGIFALAYDATASWPVALTGYHLGNVEGTAGVESGVQGITLDATYLYAFGKKHDFYAYYPYDAALTVAASSAPTVTTTLSSANQPDLMWATKVEKIPADFESGVMLNFNHALSLIRLNIIKNATVTEELKLTKISLTTSKSQVITMNIATGDVSVSGNTPTTFGYSPADYTIATTAAVDPLKMFLFAPLSPITKVVMTIDGVDYETAADFSFPTLDAGHATVMNIKLNPIDIAITIGEGEWGDGGEIVIGDHRIETSITVGEGAWADGGNTNVSDVVTNPGVTIGAEEWGNGTAIDGGAETVVPNPKKKPLP